MDTYWHPIGPMYMDLYNMYGLYDIEVTRLHGKKAFYLEYSILDYDIFFSPSFNGFAQQDCYLMNSNRI